MPEPIVLSWSGGKDSAMALRDLLEGHAYEVASLLTTVSADDRRVSHHGVSESLLDAQAEAIGIPLRKVYLPSGPAGGCTNEVYEALMKEVMLAYRAEGIQAVAFGDLFLRDLREWREANLAKFAMRGIFPLWNRDTAMLANDFIAGGYKARLVCVEGWLGASFAGRFYDATLLNDLPPSADPCGENGEFHTFVYEAPIFSRSLKVDVGEVTERNGSFFADLGMGDPVELPTR